MLSHVDLCSGIGGFALGFQWAGLSKPVLFCDIEPWSRKVLAKHWPDVPIATDVKELANDPDGLIPRTDPKRTILTAGYPCQPFSHAGKRLGSADTDRHIWPYLLQIVAQKRPAWCCFENVYGHVSMGLDQVLLDLEGQGYATRTFIVPACAVDAPHRRDRLWIIAHTDSQSEPNGPVNGSQGQRLQASADVSDTECKQRERGLSGHGQTFGAREGWPPKELAGCGEDVADTDNKGPQGRLYWGKDTQRQSVNGYIRCGGAAHRQPAQNWWLTEPSVGRVAHGIPKRVDRLRGLGNAIVPQIAMKIGEAIKASIDEAKQ